MRLAKQMMSTDEICLLVDFSENYTMKFGNEVQSAHFGYNEHITIHQGVAYAQNEEPKCFATLSTDRRKTAEAVVTHIHKALDLIDRTYVKKLIIFSDSPSSQYRNRFTVQLLARLCDFLHIDSLEWYSVRVGTVNAQRMVSALF